MTINEQKEELEKQLCREFGSEILEFQYFDYENRYKGIVDFIIEDRKRIINPLVNFKFGKDYNTLPEAYSESNKAIDEAIKKAGMYTDNH